MAEEDPERTAANREACTHWANLLQTIASVTGVRLCLLSGTDTNCDVQFVRCTSVSKDGCFVIPIALPS